MTAKVARIAKSKGKTSGDAAPEPPQRGTSAPLIPYVGVAK